MRLFHRRLLNLYWEFFEILLGNRLHNYMIGVFKNFCLNGSYINDCSILYCPFFLSNSGIVLLCSAQTDSFYG